MAHGHIITNAGTLTRAGYMHYSSILNIRPCSDTDAVNVTPHYNPVPQTGLCTDCNVTYDDRSRRHKSGTHFGLGP